MSTLEVLSFDLDDTLWPVRPVIIAAEEKTRAFMAARCPLVQEKYTAEEIMQRRITLFKERKDLHHQISKLRIESTRALLLECGYSASEADQLTQEAFEIFIQARHEVECFDGVEACLEELQQQYQLAVITNGNADVKKLKLGRFFSFSIKAEDINCSKPHALPFQRTLQHFGINSEQLVHIGDHPEHDVQGAQALGIKTIWVNAPGDAWPEGTQPDAEIKSVVELPAALATLS